MQKTHDPSSAGRLEVKHLRLVQAIASEQSVTRAAGRLHLSQSAVSHQLLDLERELGARLFDRVGKRMVPTAMGARMLVSAERLLAELLALEQDLDGDSREVRIPLRVTTSCYTSYVWLPAAIGQLARTHPRVDITIVLEALKRTMAALAADEIDLALVTEPPKDTSLSVSAIVTSELVALASPQHPVLARGGAKRGTLKWRDLRGATVLVHDITKEAQALLEGAVRESWRHESGERLASPVDLRRIPLTEALIELARAKNGVVVADRCMVEAQLGGGDGLVALPFSPRAERTFYAVWRKQNPRALPMEELVGIIRKQSEGSVKRSSAPRGRGTRRLR
jgi:LysR family transcriptional regulator for metE and metH